MNKAEGSIRGASARRWDGTDEWFVDVSGAVGVLSNELPLVEIELANGSYAGECGKIISTPRNAQWLQSPLSSHFALNFPSLTSKFADPVPDVETK